MSALLLALLLLAQADNGTVSGRLLTSTATPAAGARVALSPSNDTVELIAITQTDSQGRYRFENVPPGSYYIVGGRVDAATLSGNAIVVTARSVVEAPELQLLDGSGGFTAKGRVVLEGLPAGQSFTLAIHFIEVPQIRGALGSARRIIATIAQDGSFEMHGLIPGNYNVMFFPNVNQGPRDPVTIDHNVDNLQFRIPQAALQATVEGTAKVDGVAPLPPISVELIRKDSPIGSRSGWGFVEDRLSIPVVFVGEYEVKVTGLPQGYFVKAITSGSANVLTQGLKVTYPTTPKLELTLGVNAPLPGVRVPGQITNRGGITVTNLRITSATLGLTLAARPTADGAFEFPMVPPGTYAVEIIPSVDTTPTARSITVGSSNPTRVEIPLQIGRRITATTINPPPDNRFVPYIQIGGMYVRATFGGKNSAGNNKWEFLNIPPGTYSIAIGQDARLQPRVVENSRITVVVADKDVAVELNARP
jgi:hypothetical protein